MELYQCYKLLGLRSNATLEDINKAYKALALQWHPDRIDRENVQLQLQAQEKLKEINQARDSLRRSAEQQELNTQTRQQAKTNTRQTYPKYQDKYQKTYQSRQQTPDHSPSPNNQAMAELNTISPLVNSLPSSQVIKQKLVTIIAIASKHQIPTCLEPIYGAQIYEKNILKVKISARQILAMQILAMPFCIA